MKKIIVFFCIAAVAGTAFAQSIDFPTQLQRAFEDLRTAKLSHQNDARLDDLKMRINDRVQCVGMGTQECTRMLELHAVTGADHTGDRPIAPAYMQAKEKAKDAYESEIAGASKEHVRAAKRLYAAWLTEIDTFAAYDGDPFDFDQTPSAIAYTQAANEYKIDEGD